MLLEPALVCILAEKNSEASSFFSLTSDFQIKDGGREVWTGGRGFSCTCFIFTLMQSDWGINLMDVVTKGFEMVVVSK